MDSKFIQREVMPQPICNGCIHYLGYGKCKAFDRIPKEFATMKKEHRVLISGQKGDYVFEPKKQA